LDEDSGLGILEVAMRRASLGPGWTRVTISGVSESDHYRFLLCSLLFGGGRELSLEVISFRGL